MKRRGIFAAMLVAMSVIGLTACSSGSSDGVEVTGDFGSAATVTVNGNLNASSLHTNTIITGDGQALNSGDNAEVGVAVYDPTNQKDLVPYSTAYSLSQWQQYFVPLSDALKGQTIGSRVTVVSSASDLIGEGNASTYFGLSDSDPIVTVVDITGQVSTEDPQTTDSFSDADFPNVTLDESGAPTTTITTGVTPSTTKVKVLTPGSGATVASGDSVSFHYQLTRLRDGKQIQSNYGSDPATSTADPNNLIPGFVTAIVGQQVGSTVLAVIPPAEGYGDGTASGSTLEHETLVFVLTIESTGPATE